VSLPFFLACKYTAFKSRGALDPRTSKDLEDITYILDNRMNLVAGLSNAPADVQDFLKDAFREILRDGQIREAMLSNLYYDSQKERFEMFIKKIRTVVGE
jgi:hypothetical protein